MEIKRTELYDTISTICKDAYAIGLHGVDYNRMDKFYGVDHDKGLESIFNNGLQVFNARTINGTVKFFGRIDLERDKEKLSDGLNNYTYRSKDYIIIALPVILKTRHGYKLYQGCPNLNTKYKDYIGSKGYEKTTFADTYALDEQHRVVPEYILGRFRVLEDGYVDLYLNDRHMSDTNLVSEAKYDYICEKISRDVVGISIYSLTPSCFGNIDDVNEEYIKRVISSFEEKLPRTYYVCETLEQLLEEKKLIKRF